MNYISQRDDFSCAPIAIINILRWQNNEAGYSLVGAWRGILRTKAVVGTTNRVSRMAIRGFGGVQVFRPNLRKMRKLLNDDQGLVVRIQYGRKKGHLFCIDRATPKGFWCINLYRGSPARRWVADRTLIRELTDDNGQFRVFRFNNEVKK